MPDVAPLERNAAAMQWKRSPSGLLYPVNAKGKAVNVSHSTLEAMGRCKLRCWFDKVACVPRMPKEAPDRGSRIHELLEYYGKKGEWPGPDFTVKQKDVKGETIEVKPTVLDRTCARSAEHLVPLHKGVTHEEGVFLKEVFTDGKGATCGFSGKIDLFDPKGTLNNQNYFLPFQKDGWAVPLSTPSIGDYKTKGTSSMRYRHSPETLAFDKQLARYVVGGMIGSAKSPLFGGEEVPEETIVFHINIGTGTIEVKPVAAVMKRETVEAVWEETTQGAVQLLDLCRIDKVEDVPYNKGACGDFRGCDHAAICPRSPQNNRPKGRLGGLFGFNSAASRHKDTSTPTTKEPTAMASKKFSIKSLRKAAKAAPAPTEPPVKTVEEVTPTAAPVKTVEEVTPTAAPAKPSGGANRRGRMFGSRTNKSRTQAPDAGVVKATGKKKGETGEPIVADVLVKDAIAVAKVAAKENGIPLDYQLVRRGCEEVNLDFDAAIDALQAALPGVDLKVQATNFDPEAEAAARAEEAGAEPTAAEALAAPIKELAKQIPATVPDVTAPVKAALDAVKAYLMTQPDYESTLGKARKAASKAYNAIAPDPIKRWTHVADKRIFRQATWLNWQGKDAAGRIWIETSKLPIGVEEEWRPSLSEEVAEAPSVEETSDEAHVRVCHEEGICPVGAEWGNHSRYTDGCTCPEPAPAAPEAPVAPKAPEAAPEAAPAARPVIFVDCFPVGQAPVDFDAWLLPYAKVVEQDEKVHYYGAIPYNNGPGLVANVIARDIAQRGAEVLPAMLRVDSRHKAWHAVRSVLYGLPAGSVVLVEGVK